MSPNRYFLLTAIGGLVLAGCGESSPDTASTSQKSVPQASQTTKEPEPKAAGGPDNKGDASAESAKQKPREVSVAGFKFMVPGDWEEQAPRSQFIMGEFSIPGEGGPARLTLSSANGGIEANVERWKGQFNRGPSDPDPRESEITLDGKKGTLLELSGTFTDMFSGGVPNKNWRLLGVAVPLGPTNYFIKLTGPATVVTPRKDEFLQFVDSARMLK